MLGAVEGLPRRSSRKCWTEPRQRTDPSRVDIPGAIEEIRQIERQYAPAAGVTPAAYAAQLAQARERIVDSEFRIAVGDDGVGEVLLRLLCVRYGLTPFRRPRQRASSLSVLAPEVFVREVLVAQTEAILAVLTRAMHSTADQIFTGWRSGKAG